MRKINLLYFATVIVSLFILSCSNLTKSNTIEGKYLKTEGSGGVFENASLTIEKLDENSYEVSGYNSNGEVEWQESATVQGEKNVIGWTDKWLPIKITFNNNNAEMVAGEGTFGRFKFKKEN